MAKNNPLGQNFLTDQSFVTDIVTAGSVTKNDVVLEIGAGKGVVTNELVKVAGQVFAVEIDPTLIPTLNNLRNKNSKLEIINEDVLRVMSDRTRILEIGITKFIGSIPYQITSPLIHLIVNNFNLPATLLMQKEVAARLTAKPPQATYLSNYVQNWAASVNLIKIVPKEVFDPVPEVDGAIVTLIPKVKSDFDTVKFSHFLHKGFSSPRKMLNKIFAKELLLSVEIEPTRRAETLSLEEWSKLYDAYLPIR